MKKGAQKYIGVIFSALHENIGVAHTSAWLFWSGTNKSSRFSFKSTFLQYWGTFYGLFVT